MIATMTESLIIIALSVAAGYFCVSYLLDLIKPGETIDLWPTMAMGAFLFLKDLYYA